MALCPDGTSEVGLMEGDVLLNEKNPPGLRWCGISCSWPGSEQ